MEIEFNPSRIPISGAGKTTGRKSVASTASSATSLGVSTDLLKSKLQEIPLVRPGKVGLGQALVADMHYPPDYVLDRVAVLLALNLRS